MCVLWWTNDLSKVCSCFYKVAELRLWIGTLSFHFNSPPPILSTRLWNICGTLCSWLSIWIIVLKVLWVLAAMLKNMSCTCVYWSTCSCVFVPPTSVNGKFQSHLSALFFHSSLSSPRSSPHLFDTRLCVKWVKNWKCYVPQIVWRVFPLSLWQSVYNSSALVLYLFLKPPLIHTSGCCYVSAKSLLSYKRLPLTDGSILNITIGTCLAVTEGNCAKIWKQKFEKCSSVERY